MWVTSSCESPAWLLPVTHLARNPLRRGADRTGDQERDAFDSFWKGQHSLQGHKGISCC